jgi:hypothetical protein
MSQFQTAELNGRHGIGKRRKNDNARLHQFRGGTAGNMITSPTHRLVVVAIWARKI